MTPEQLRLRLLSRIQRRYQTVTLPVRIGALQVEFTRVAEPDRVLDEAVAEETRRQKNGAAGTHPTTVPYWAEVWESAFGVGNVIAAMNLANAPVLDLGCGMGLAGTLAAAGGARVLLADLEMPALLFARFNTLPWLDRARTRQLNWQTDRLRETFDLIIGADILYERVQWDFLEPFWRTHLSPGGSVLLGEPGRQTGDLFPEWIKSRGWTIEESIQPVPMREKPVRIFQIRALPR